MKRYKYINNNIKMPLTTLITGIILSLITMKKKYDINKINDNK